MYTLFRKPTSCQQLLVNRFFPVSGIFRCWIDIRCVRRRIKRRICRRTIVTDNINSTISAGTARRTFTNGVLERALSQTTRIDRSSARAYSIRSSVFKLFWFRMYILQRICVVPSYPATKGMACFSSTRYAPALTWRIQNAESSRPRFSQASVGDYVVFALLEKCAHLERKP